MHANPSLSTGDSLDPAQPADYPAMATVIARTLREVNSQDYPSDVIEGLVVKYNAENLGTFFKDKHVLALKRKGEVIGTGAYDGTEITCVFVHPSCRGRGLGKVIMSALEDVARNQGKDSVMIHASITALKFYESIGYQHGDRVTREVGGESLRMYKILK